MEEMLGMLADNSGYAKKKEVCAFLKISVDTLDREIKTGSIDGVVRVKRGIRIPWQSVKSYIERNRVQSLTEMTCSKTKSRCRRRLSAEASQMPGKRVYSLQYTSTGLRLVKMPKVKNAQ